MAIVKRRYVFAGPSDRELKLEIDAQPIPPPTLYQTYDVQYDDTVADAAAVDDVMFRSGYMPEPVPTTVLSPEPFIGLRSPLGDVWALVVDNLGVLTTTKVN